MNRQTWTKGFGQQNWVKMILAAGIALVLVKLFVPERGQSSLEPDPPFSFKTCMESVPSTVNGLKIMEGSRSESSIIVDMVPITCRARALYERMRSVNDGLVPGHITIRVVVEYTGEVISVDVEQTDMTSRKFNNKIIEMIANSDFVSWPRDDTDTEFVYDISFGK